MWCASEEISINSCIITRFLFEPKHFPGNIAGPYTLHLLDNRSAMRISISMDRNKTSLLAIYGISSSIQQEVWSIDGLIGERYEATMVVLFIFITRILKFGVNQPIKLKHTQENSIASHNVRKLSTSFALTSHFMTDGLWNDEDDNWVQRTILVLTTLYSKRLLLCTWYCLGSGKESLRDAKTGEKVRHFAYHSSAKKWCLIEMC